MSIVVKWFPRSCENQQQLFVSQLWGEEEEWKKMKGTLEEEEEAPDSDDITAVLLHNSTSSQSAHFLSGWNSPLIRRRGADGAERHPLNMKIHNYHEYIKFKLMISTVIGVFLQFWSFCHQESWREMMSCKRQIL